MITHDQVSSTSYLGETYPHDNNDCHGSLCPECRCCMHCDHGPCPDCTDNQCGCALGL